jgi:uncharacterized cupredoxin-like copper-binding protein
LAACGRIDPLVGDELRCVSGCFPEESIVQRIRIAIIATIIAAAVAACSSAGAAPSTAPASSALPAASSVVAGSPVTTASPVAASSPSAAATAVAAETTISLYEWKVIAPTTLKAGTTTFTISNFGTVPHELLIFKSPLAANKYPVDAAGDIEEEGAGVDLLSDGENIDPAGSQVRAVDLTPGTYLFVCNIPGHFKNGMFSVLTVTE